MNRAQATHEPPRRKDAKAFDPAPNAYALPPLGKTSAEAGRSPLAPLRLGGSIFFAQPLARDPVVKRWILADQMRYF
jgi:hypothetical protein